jgi:hypothetical protein
MTQLHPFVRSLAEKVRQRKNQQMKMTARRLIQGFGFERRTERVINEIVNHMQAQQLTTLSLVSRLWIEDNALKFDGNLNVSAQRMFEVLRNLVVIEFERKAQEVGAA